MKDGTFRPDQPITREEMVYFINSLYDIPLGDSVSFLDIEPHGLQTQMLAGAVLHGYINGFPDQTFRPDLHLSREEFAVVMMKLLGLASEESYKTFNDQAAFPLWSRGAIGAVKEAGIIQGYANGTFQPLRKVSRAEAAEMIHRSMQYKPKKTNNPLTASSFFNEVNGTLFAGPRTVITLHRAVPAGTEVWFAPSGTKTFKPSSKMTRLYGNGVARHLHTPMEEGLYYLHMLLPDQRIHISGTSLRIMDMMDVEGTIDMAHSTGALNGTVDIWRYVVDSDGGSNFHKFQFVVSDNQVSFALPYGQYLASIALVSDETESYSLALSQDFSVGPEGLSKPFEFHFDQLKPQIAYSVLHRNGTLPNDGTVGLQVMMNYAGHHNFAFGLENEIKNGYFKVYSHNPSSTHSMYRYESKDRTTFLYVIESLLPRTSETQYTLPLYLGEPNVIFHTPKDYIRIYATRVVTGVSGEGVYPFDIASCLGLLRTNAIAGVYTLISAQKKSMEMVDLAPLQIKFNVYRDSVTQVVVP